MIGPAKALISAGGLAFLFQTVLPVPNPIPADSLGALLAFAEKLTVNAALFGGLWWMARRYDKKDEQVVTMTAKFTEVTVLFLDAMKETRVSVERVESKLDIRNDHAPKRN